MKWIKSYRKFYESNIDLSGTTWGLITKSNTDNVPFKGAVYFELIPDKNFYYYKITLSDTLKDELRSKGKNPDAFYSRLLFIRKIQEQDKIQKIPDIHFTGGISYDFRNIGLGYHIYKEFIKFIGWGVMQGEGSPEAKKVAARLAQDKNIYSAVAHYMILFDKKHSQKISPIEALKQLIKHVYDVDRKKFNQLKEKIVVCQDFNIDYPNWKNEIDDYINTLDPPLQNIKKVNPLHQYVTPKTLIEKGIQGVNIKNFYLALQQKIDSGENIDIEKFINQFISSDT